MQRMHHIALLVGADPMAFCACIRLWLRSLRTNWAHVIDQRAPVQREFDALVTAADVHPFTRYAASNPKTEFFPEACALYLLDPAWVNDNHPELYARVQAYLKRPQPGGL